MPTCIGITSKGIECGKTCSDRETRCKTHKNVIAKIGPNATAYKELDYKFKKIIRDEDERTAQLRLTDREAGENFYIFVQRQKIDKREALNTLLRQQRAEIARTGIDPDAPARERQRQEQQRRAALWTQRMAEQRALRDRLLLGGGGGVGQLLVVAQLGAAVRIEPVQRPLAAFAADPQNVHTTEAVNRTKDIVAKIREIPVPEEYRWHPVNCSKTPFEIGLDCKLSQKAAWQMMVQYAQDTSIYDIEVGIYGKVLDCVWQYIKASSDKNDLCAIMKREMEDNIGMCAQGNLSRICNVLAGYMEGVGAQESLSEILGRLLPPLMAIEDEFERIRQACNILKENRVPYRDWDYWVEPLLEDSMEVYTLIKEQLQLTA
jgi:hypothetical protein